MLGRTVTAFGAAIAVAALLLAVASIWLILEDPTAVANAVRGRGDQAFAEALVQVVVQVLERVVRWL